MRRLLRHASRITRSFWFIPVLCVGGAIVLAEGLVAIDRRIGDHSELPVVGSLFQLGIEGSRGILGGIGGTTFGAAATAFSITISVIATASTSYGPRLVGNFMTDRRNQWTLGVLVSTFVYTTLVVRTLRSAPDDGTAFVPHLAVHMAIVIAIVDVFLLISFIHHIAASIQVDHLTAITSNAFRRTIERTEELEDDRACSAEPPEGGELLRARSSGYIVHIDAPAVLRAVTDDNARIAFESRVGDRVVTGSPLARVWPGHDAEALADKLVTCIDLGRKHDPASDPFYAQQQVVELAVRALSPGTNDPYTAVNVIEELAPALSELVASPHPASALEDESGTPRVFLRPVTLAELIDLPFHQIVPFADGQALVHRALVDLAGHIEQHNIHPELAGRAWAHVERIRDQAARSGPDEQRELLDAHMARTRALVELSRGHADG